MHRNLGIVASLVVGAALVTVTACGAAADGADPAPAGAEAPSAVAEPSGDARSTNPVTVPNEAGRDAATAVAQLHQLGFAHVQLAAADGQGGAITDPAAWTVTRTEPSAGQAVPSDSPVEVLVTRK